MLCDVKVLRFIFERFRHDFETRDLSNYKSQSGHTTIASLPKATTAFEKLQHSN